MESICSCLFFFWLVHRFGQKKTYFGAGIYFGSPILMQTKFKENIVLDNWISQISIWFWCSPHIPPFMYQNSWQKPPASYNHSIKCHTLIINVCHALSIGQFIISLFEQWSCIILHSLQTIYIYILRIFQYKEILHSWSLTNNIL